MTKIFKVADTTNMPKWLTPTASDTPVVHTAVSPEAVRLAAITTDLSEDQLVEERDRIEQCANSKTTYHYASTWSADTQRQLLEYASICQVKSEAVASAAMQVQAAAVVPASLQKTAAVEAPAPAQTPAQALAESVAALIGDPFHLADAGDMKHMAASDWESIKPAVHASDRQSIAMTSASVINIGATNEASVPRYTRVAPGQNSMMEPNAIGALAESADNNTSARLRQEAKDRHSKRTDANRQRDAEMVAKAEAAEQEFPGITPRGTVMATDAKAATGGFKGGQLVLASELPELTAGEKIRQGNQDRKAGIQRQKVADRTDWDTLKGASRHEMQILSSETILDALKKQMGE